MHKAMFPGSFDPPTSGHIDIINRASKFFDLLYVVVAENITKKSMFTVYERVEMLKNIFKDNEKIKVTSYSGLSAEFAKENNVDVMVRGVRAQDDFNFEFEMAMNNRLLNKQLDVFFIPTDQKYFLVRSSQVKEFATFGADISDMVPKEVEKKILEKVGRS